MESSVINKKKRFINLIQKNYFNNISQMNKIAPKCHLKLKNDCFKSIKPKEL